jgi:hypothetical protein
MQEEDVCLWATVFAASRNSLDVPSVADPMKYTKKELRRGGKWECTMRFRKDKSNTPARSTPRERGARACLKGPSKVVAAWGCQSDGKGSLCPEDSGSTTAQTLCSPTLALTIRQTRRGMAVTSTFRRTETLKPLCSQTCLATAAPFRNAKLATASETTAKHPCQKQRTQSSARGETQRIDTAIGRSALYTWRRVIPEGFSEGIEGQDKIMLYATLALLHRPWNNLPLCR